ncbi:hypothetical protein [Herpetosiphon geysericola]|uniref:Uncharacterized protein n=1 Tax=Herpetosiphon geysericola TaxID=70996 RepID=A0A0P6YXM7_9CHLR|nr:hypothetical protein [Herpetosiphon geysericola]KPL89976.1 hypothetical protein SE18_08445 [Herpetosiphon geysericola]
MAQKMREKMVHMKELKDVHEFMDIYNQYANAAVEDDIHFDEEDEDIIVGCSGFQYLPDVHEGIIVLKVVDKVKKSKKGLRREV